MRVVPPCQLALPIGEQSFPADWWSSLPEARRAEVLALLGRMIARGVIADETASSAEASR